MLTLIEVHFWEDVLSQVHKIKQIAKNLLADHANEVFIGKWYWINWDGNTPYNMVECSVNAKNKFCDVIIIIIATLNKQTAMFTS